MAPLTASTLTIWTGLACQGGMLLGTLSAFLQDAAPTERRTRTGEDQVLFSVGAEDPYADYLTPQRVVRLTYSDTTWSEWRIEAETTDDGSADTTRSFRAKPILLDLHDGGLCIDWTIPTSESLTGGMASATIQEFWDTIGLPSLAVFGIDYIDLDLSDVDDPSRTYDFAYDGQSVYSSILSAVSGEMGGRKRLRLRPDGTTQYLLGVKSRLDDGAPTVLVAPDRNLQKLTRQWATERQATHVAMRGRDDTGTAQHVYRVSAYTAGVGFTLVDPEGRVDPLRFANQVTAKYLRRLSTGRHLYIAGCTPGTQVVGLGALPGSGLYADPVDGELVEFRATAPPDNVPVPDRHALLSGFIRTADPFAYPSTTLDWRLGSLNTGAQTAVVSLGPYIAAQLTGAGASQPGTLADTLVPRGIVGLPAAADLPIDQWVHPLHRIYQYVDNPLAPVRWFLVHTVVGGADTYTFDPVSGGPGYGQATLPSAIAVGDVLYGSRTPTGISRAIRITSIASGGGSFTADPLLPGSTLAVITQWDGVEAFRFTNGWIQVEAFDRTTQTLTFGAGFAAAVSAGDIANGDAFVFAVNDLGRGLITLSDPVSEALYGTVVRTATDTRIPGVRNLHADGLFADWPSGDPVPHGWSQSGTAPSRSTSALYEPLGDAVILIDHGGSTGLTTTLRSRWMRPWLLPTVTEVALRLPYLLTSPAPTTAPTITIGIYDQTDGRNTLIPHPDNPYTVPADAVKYDVGDHITVAHIPITPLIRDLQVQVVVAGLGDAQCAVRGIQVTATGEPPAGPEVRDVGGPELLAYSGSNTLWGMALDRLSAHADPRVAAAAYSLALTDRFRTNPTAFSAEELRVDGTIQLENARVDLPPVTLEIVELTLNLRDPRLTEIAVGLPISDAAETLASVSVPSSGL